MLDDPLAAYLNQIVVLDTQGPMIYIGTLDRIDPAYLVLTQADVHDTNDSRATKDLYLVDVRNLGVHPNRGQVIVMRAQIASISLLKDIVD